MEKSKKVFKSILKWLGIAANVILVAIVLLNLYTIVMRFVTKKEVIPVFGIATALVETGSMEGDRDDSIDGYDMIFTVKSKEYVIGDIITFDTGGQIPTTHRIIEIEGDKFITQGDANNNKDSQKVSEDQIIGKVFFTIPRVGYFVHFMKTPFGMLILVLVCFFIIYAPSFLKPKTQEAEDGDGGESNDSKTTPELESETIPEIETETEEKTTESE